MTYVRSDGRAHDRKGFGHAHKITPVQRDEIAYRRMEGDTAKVLAVEYGVSAALIYTIEPRERS